MTKMLFLFYYTIPAPGSYDVEKADKKIHESSPAYSLGVKYKEQKPDEIPGNRYINFFMTYIINLISETKFTFK